MEFNKNILALADRPIMMVRRRAIEGVAQVEDPGERCGAAGTRGGMALAQAHPSLHCSAQMENPTKASTATLRTIIAIAVTSTMPSQVKCHDALLGGSRATALIYRQTRRASALQPHRSR
jgi:hypothetical protein